MTETKEVTKHVLRNYQNIAGLRGYVVYDNTVIQSASGKDYFCKRLKSSNKVLEECEECTEKTYENARKVDHEYVYPHHAGLIKWAVPVQRGDFHCVIVSGGVLAMKQMEDTDKWAKYLNKEYQLDKDMLLKNFKVIQMTDEDQMSASIELLRDLLSYHSTMVEKQV